MSYDKKKIFKWTSILIIYEKNIGIAGDVVVFFLFNIYLIKKVVKTYFEISF
jgi:hypothetical protein